LVVVMMKIRHNNRLFLILVLSSLLITLILPAAPAKTVNDTTDNAMPIIPEVTIELIDTNKTADVGPGSSCMVEFDGKVTVRMNQLTRVVVSLAAEDTWGSAVVSPSTLLFTGNGEQPFSVSVQAPPKESCTTVGTVTVTGRWRMYPGTLGGSAEPSGGVRGTINIAQYCRFSVAVPNNREKNTVAGSEAQFVLNIVNEGNGRDSFGITICNIDQLEDKGYRIKINQMHVVLNQNETGPVVITIQVPDDKDCEEQDIDVIIVSETNGATTADILTSKC
jgi:hypothetical protein